MLESTEGERLPCPGMFSGGKDVWRRCEGPACETLRRFWLVDGELSDGRFFAALRCEIGGEPAGGEVAIVNVRCGFDGR
jgi:hypothetical protein